MLHNQNRGYMTSVIMTCMITYKDFYAFKIIIWALCMCMVLIHESVDMWSDGLSQSASLDKMSKYSEDEMPQEKNIYCHWVLHIVSSQDRSGKSHHTLIFLTPYEEFFPICCRPYRPSDPNPVPHTGHVILTHTLQSLCFTLTYFITSCISVQPICAHHYGAFTLQICFTHSFIFPHCK